MDDYSSSPERLASWFLESRNKWKEKALHKQKELRKAGIKIRDLQNSREKWKKRAQQNQAKIEDLEREIKMLKKNYIDVLNKLW